MIYQTNLNVTNGSKHSTLPRDQTTTRLPGENGMNGSHTIPRNFNMCYETTQIDGASANLKALMGQDILSSQSNPTTKDDEWFV
jgi:hypothetical protein